jgi:hypothetical protein
MYCSGLSHDSLHLWLHSSSMLHCAAVCSWVRAVSYSINLYDTCSVGDITSCTVTWALSYVSAAQMRWVPAFKHARKQGCLVNSFLDLLLLAH